ncbi:MAG TPA: hypothetical protein VFB08_19065 [Burkholderiales bacterium]|nr:hypothetical protein [Burkholderiales bacterium]
MKRCENCKSLMPEDAAHCIRCGHDSSKRSSTHAAATPDQAPARPSKVNWLRVSATVLSSNLFFLGSCSAVLFGAGALEDPNDYGPAITAAYPGPKLTSVVATVPDAKNPGQRKTVVVLTSTLQEFEAKNPDFSFLLPVGEGTIDTPEAEMLTQYKVRASGPGKIIVESRFHHDVPPAGIDVRQRYEATAHEVRMLNAKFAPGYLGPLIAGLVVASILAVTGRILRRRIAPTEPAPSAEEVAAVKKKATRRTLKILAIAIAVGVLITIALVGISALLQ